MIKRFSVLLMIVSSLYLPSSYAAPGQCDQWVAKIVSIQGKVEARAGDESRWYPAQLDQTYCPGDIIHVLKNSRTAIVLGNETITRLDQNSTIVLSGLENKQASWLDLLEGAIHFISRVSRSLKIKTPYVNAAIEGTEFLVRVADGQTQVSVIEGLVAVENSQGRLLLAANESSLTKAEQGPQRRLDIRSRDAVNWSLYYPSLKDIGPDVSIIEDAKDSTAMLMQRANDLLSVGRVDEVTEILSSVIAAEPRNGSAHAMLAIIALTQNNKDQALELVEKAMDYDPDSIEVRLALSYVYQSRFKLDEALAVIETLVESAPANALVWARLAEIRLSLGDTDGALSAARQAVRLNPEQARSHMVLGFVYLSHFNVVQARETFETAIMHDQANPLSRLGLGLAMIRTGDLANGRREVEIATTLDPGNALLRSYLGKAYYEERRDGLAEEQFTMSKELDPQDPTPWFYDAIRKQSSNRPVEALADLQQSIKLNDNRAVYRSRLLLDQDLAARSASLARIYSDLGFQRLALNEGWKSTNMDPGNHSAHRFLADAYSKRPRHEIARLSELLQSQLLQPINLNPIQPQLAESNLGILDGAGPAEMAFNEFNPMFVRNRLAMQLNGVRGSNDTHGSDLVFSGLKDKYSYSLGQYHYHSDGFRDNNDQEKDIHTAFLQTALSHKTSVQFEYRDTDSETGDLWLRFDPTSFVSTARNNTDQQILRAGFHHSFSPTSRILVSVSSLDLDEKLQFSSPASTIKSNSMNDGHLTEIQHQQVNRYIRFISGLGNYRRDTESITKNTTTNLTLQNFDGVDEHDNAYLYSTWDKTRSLILVTGLSWDGVDNTGIEIDQFNPKFGLSWDIDADNTLRLAAFRAVKRDMVSNQTLEPTQVVGFNQFYDDSNYTNSKQYGMALDNKSSRNLYLGLEAVRRDLDVYIWNGQVTTVSNWDDRFARAYLYWMPNNRMVVNIDYQFEQFERPPGSTTEDFLKLESQRIPLELRLFLSSNISIKLKTSYIEQEGKFVEYIQVSPFVPPTEVISISKDAFWLTDAELSYRLPKHYGKISVGAKNVFDEDFQYQFPRMEAPTFIPECFVYSRLTLAF